MMLTSKDLFLEEKEFELKQKAADIAATVQQIKLEEEYLYYNFKQINDASNFDKSNKPIKFI